MSTVDTLELMQLAKNLEAWPIEKLKPYERNARTHSESQVRQIAASIAEFGFTNPILVDSQAGIIAGHGRLMAAKELGLSEVPVVVLDHLSEAQRKAYIIADNKLALNAGWDMALLSEELGELKDEDFDLDLIGFSDFEISSLLNDGVLPPEPQVLEPGEPAGDSGGNPANGSVVVREEEPRKLSDRFLVPPFSVLDQRQGYWQERKRQWLAMGIKSEVGRGANLLGMSETVLQGDPEGGTSIFDPVLCELAYRWFSPVGGTVLDPFAGGSVRGVVASKVGRQYIGIELREEQVAANREQATAICSDPMPAWHCGDSTRLDEIAGDVQADLVFSCPPYADLEVYSEDPRDLSTMDYEAFVASYREIIRKAVAQLKENRFACFVVTEVREKGGGGFYRNFVKDTIEAFEDAGARFYNEAILVNSVGTLALRVGRIFPASRKLGRTHQNVLVFCKGDPMKATQACGEIEIVDLEEQQQAPAQEAEATPEPNRTAYGEMLTADDLGGEV